jgi:hypothetical protein
MAKRKILSPCGELSPGRAARSLAAILTGGIGHYSFLYIIYPSTVIDHAKFAIYNHKDGRRRYAQEDKLECILRKWVHLDLERDQWRAVLKTVMNLRVI